MKARITHLKAPWPSGALVGAVVLFESGVVPTWAAGKCVPAEDGDEVDVTVPVPAESSEPARLSEADQVREEARQFIARQQAEFEQHAQDMQAKLQALTGENESLGTALAEARSKLAAAEEGKAAAVKSADDLQGRVDDMSARLNASVASKKK